MQNHVHFSFFVFITLDREITLWGSFQWISILWLFYIWIIMKGCKFWTDYTRSWIVSLNQIPNQTTLNMTNFLKKKPKEVSKLLRSRMFEYCQELTWKAWEGMIDGHVVSRTRGAKLERRVRGRRYELVRSRTYRNCE